MRFHENQYVFHCGHCPSQNNGTCLLDENLNIPPYVLSCSLPARCPLTEVFSLCCGKPVKRRGRFIVCKRCKRECGIVDTNNGIANSFQVGIPPVHNWWGLKQDGEVVAALRSERELAVEDFDDIPLSEGCRYEAVPLIVREVSAKRAHKEHLKQIVAGK